jgi:hypothetical protein
MYNKRVKRAAVLAIALVVVLVSTGRVGQSRSAQAAVRDALARTADARSMRFTVRWTGAAVPTGPAGQIEGVMDYARNRGEIRYFGDIEDVYDGDVMYTKWPLPWQKGSRWVRYDEGADEPDPLSLEDRALRNPVSLLKFLREGSSDVRKVGTEDVSGASTDHYEGTLDLQRVVDHAPAADRAELQALLDFIREDAEAKVPFGLWADGSGIAHRLRIDEAGGVSVVVDYFDFGVPVSITPPSKDEIMSYEALFEEIRVHSNTSDCAQSEAGEPAAAGSGGLTSEGESIGSATVTLCVDEIQTSP